MAKLQGKKVLMFVENFYEDLELWYPRFRLMEAGADVTLAGPDKDTVYKGKHGYPCKPDMAIDEIDPGNFDILVLCGGYAPDKLRRIPKVLDVTRSMFESEKPVAMICHAGWVPISAGIVQGRTCTSVSAIRDDLVNAGGEWVDQEVVVDKNLISSRTPDDLPAFCRAIIDQAAG
ncbi:MAG: type 1 glutamine amidotransferase domain-containing protein [Desulfovibrionales bacterium]